jgi:hypothetical protein
MSKRYVLANISIPLEIDASGNITHLTQYSQVVFDYFSEEELAQRKATTSPNQNILLNEFLQKKPKSNRIPPEDEDVHDEESLPCTSDGLPTDLLQYASGQEVDDQTTDEGVSNMDEPPEQFFILPLKQKQPSMNTTFKSHRGNMRNITSKQRR